MTLHQPFSPAPADPGLDRIIKVAILAVGGQGGGVLTSWIEDLARRGGYVAQATSVAGVAQRTGATVYYIEMAPDSGTAPVFALAPSAGDVDVMIAAEMMEAGRSIQRGFVTPDRTVLIASTHRALAVSEKMVPGDGIASSDEVMAAAEIAARQLVAADFDRLAIAKGSVISASLFGALAGSGALPFPRAAFEDAIRAGGKGVEASLRAFGAGFDAASAPSVPAAPDNDAPARQVADSPAGPAALRARWQDLAARVAALPAPVAAMARHGLRKVVDFQDLDYGAEYLARLEEVLARDEAAQDWLLTAEAAKYIANAMAYDDVIRVADLKTRPARMSRIRDEMRVSGDNLMHLTEFMHPRAEEIAGMMPAGLGRRIQGSARAMKWLDRLFGHGRRLRSDGMIGFALLHLLGGMRGWRLRSLRHAQEQHHLNLWLGRALSLRAADYALAVEMIRCRRLIKGYSDTHGRGISKFDRVTAAADSLTGRADAADWIRRLREAALMDEEGQALDEALMTIRGFTRPAT
ncbi:MAG: indolepyruvate oxidoreductase subunit beta family protein [Paracoccus sp. (in: a-proteobacteria)]|nr:indolepyruvate oxidoreductase subunit beta family protein [Paracoccus sp. (in: a-proteobacteria)]